MKMAGFGAWGLVVSLLAGCGAHREGPRIRVATASAAELQGALKEDTVWYEFQPGDIVPVHFAFMGAIEGGSDNPAVFRAKQHFFFVTTKNGSMRLSFDGETFAGTRSSQSVIVVAPRKGGKGGQLLWAIYMGESGDAEGEFDRLLAESEAAPAPAPRAAE